MVMADIVIMHPLASSLFHVRLSVKGGEAACAAKATKHRKYVRSGTGASVIVPLAHEK